MPPIELVDLYTVPDAVEVLWGLLVERSDDPFINVSHRSLPTRAEHEAFVARRPFHRWYLIKTDGGWAGYVNVTMRNEIGTVLARTHCGKGIGTAAVRALMGMIVPLPAIPSERPGHFVANINPRNDRSIRMFSRLGFKHIQNTYAYVSEGQA